MEIPEQAVEYIAEADGRGWNSFQSHDCVVALDRHACSLWICGSDNAVYKSEERIYQMLDKWNKEHAVIYFDHKHQATSLIGGGGANIRELQETSGAKIDINVEKLTCVIVGSEQNVSAAKKIVLDKIKIAAKPKSSRASRW